MLTGKKVGPNKKKHQRKKKHEWGRQTVAAVDSLQLTCWDLEKEVTLPHTLQKLFHFGEYSSQVHMSTSVACLQYKHMWGAITWLAENTNIYGLVTDAFIASKLWKTLHFGVFVWVFFHLLYVSYSGYQWNPDIQDRLNTMKNKLS